MIKKIIDPFGTTIYVQIWENRIKVSDIKTGEIFDEPPLVAIETKKNGQKVIVAIGADAKLIAPTDNIAMVNPFSHPRSLIKDFVVAEKLLQHALHVLFKRKFLVPSPLAVVQPMEKLEGGLTLIEKRAFREFGYGAGARDVILRQGEELDISNFDLNSNQVSGVINEDLSAKPDANRLHNAVFALLLMGLMILLFISL